jgi:uncharacterized protein
MSTSLKRSSPSMDVPDSVAIQDAYSVAANPPQHSLLRSACLHLLPGGLNVLFACLVGPLIIWAKLPLLLLPSMWAFCVLIPVELGYLLIQGKRRNGRLSLEGIVQYRTPMSVRSYVFLVPVLFIWGILGFLMGQPSEAYLSTTLFAWMPGWFHTMFAIDTSGARGPAIARLAVVLFLVSNPAAAYVEELYFRGYLLPRIAHLNGWAPLINTVLFSAQHFFSPWQNLGRILAFLPIAYAVAWKKNIAISIIVHCTLNVLSAILLLLTLFG